MSEIKNFCPNCGHTIGTSRFCEQCGLEVTSDIPQSTTNQHPSVSVSQYSEKAPYYDPDTWSRLEPWVSLAGRFSWILIFLNILINGIATIARYVVAREIYLADIEINGTTVVFPANVTWELIWMIVSVLLTIMLASLFVKPFSIQCRNKNWKGLVDDIVMIGSYRIPKMLLLGVIMSIFTYGWGSMFVLIPAILIILIGPHKHQWQK